MPKFAIAFIDPSAGSALRHRIIESENQDTALRRFFDEELKDSYSEDDQGFYYFKEDFLDEKVPSGSIIKV